MLYTKTKAIRPILVKGLTRKPGFIICPAECLVNTQQELGRGRIEPLEDFVADGNVWATEPKEVATLFAEVTFDFVQEWGRILQKMEQENPDSPATLGSEKEDPKSAGRTEMILAIKNEALRRRDASYHNKTKGV